MTKQNIKEKGIKGIKICAYFIGLYIVLEVLRGIIVLIFHSSPNILHHIILDSIILLSFAITIVLYKSQKKSTKLLKISEQKFKSLFDHGAQAMFSLDVNGYFTDVNKRCEDVIGYSQEEILDKHFSKVIVIDEELQKSLDSFKEVMSTLEPNTYIMNYVRKSKVSNLRIVSVPIVVDDKVVGIHCTVIDITKQLEHNKTIERMAYHDVLTGLPNRMHFNKNLKEIAEKSKKNHEKVAVLFLDLDGFKEVNDSIGHSGGDELLKMVAERLVLSLRTADIVCRLGGDEFTVILRDVKNEKIINNVAQKIIDVISQPYTIIGRKVKITASVGAVMSDCKSIDTESLIIKADTAMYKAKGLGKNQYYVHDDVQNVG